ncbi:hypothetical protein MNBD_GAMMA08-2322 [hydrothermal vent metagenome]|uniref:Uncharacterized protein n=1 Tax=hydrothermal vent metagenome TaxID=652676 RepID=A0A3B0X8P6_9ZZZZ
MCVNFYIRGKTFSAEGELNARKTTHARYSIHTPDTGRGGMGLEMETGISRGDAKCQPISENSDIEILFIAFSKPATKFSVNTCGMQHIPLLNESEKDTHWSTIMKNTG